MGELETTNNIVIDIYSSITDKDSSPVEEVTERESCQS